MVFGLGNSLCPVYVSKYCRFEWNASHSRRGFSVLTTSVHRKNYSLFTLDVITLWRCGTKCGWREGSDFLLKKQGAFAGSDPRQGVTAKLSSFFGVNAHVPCPGMVRHPCPSKKVVLGMFPMYPVRVWMRCESNLARAHMNHETTLTKQGKVWL